MEDIDPTPPPFSAFLPYSVDQLVSTVLCFFSVSTSMWRSATIKFSIFPIGSSGKLRISKLCFCLCVCITMIHCRAEKYLLQRSICCWKSSVLPGFFLSVFFVFIKLYFTPTFSSDEVIQQVYCPNIWTRNF